MEALIGEFVAEDTSDPSCNRRKATFEPRPFSSGSSRSAYKGKFTHPSSESGKEIVVKRFKSTYALYKSDWKFDIKTTEKAAELAAKFNTASNTDKPINFRSVIPMQVTCVQVTCEFFGFLVGEWVAAERYLYGDFTKWLSNNGWVNYNPGLSLPAFSHWTWVATGGQVLVCDLQGVCDNPMGYWLTDPAIHSPQQEYGNTDRGNVGIHDFFKTHVCTIFCKHLGIDKIRPPPQSLCATGTTPQRSSSYNDAGVVRLNTFIPQLAVIQE